MNLPSWRFKRFLSLFLFSFVLNTQAFAQFDPGTTIFVMPNVSGSDIRDVVEDIQNEVDNASDAGAGVVVTEDGDKKDTTVSIPVRQDDGSYEVVDIGFSEEDNVRTISIPDRGDVSIIEDEDGNYNFELTPEQIKGSSNITCQVGANKKGTCTIEPFITTMGEKVLSADKMVVSYTEGENLVVAGGEATNLRLTDPNSQTGFNNSETNAGDSTIRLSFSKEESSNSSILPEAPKLKEQRFLRLDLNTSQMTHTVSNPNNPSESKVKWQVKDGGVSSSIVIDRQEHTTVSFLGSTQGGITYDSNPFSDKSVKIDTTAPIRGQISFNNNPEAPSSSIALQIDGSDKDGNPSVTSIVDNRSDKRTDTLTATGSTFLNLSQAIVVDEDSGKIIDSSQPVAFELGSNSLRVENEFSNGKKNQVQLDGLRSSGVVNPSNDNKQVVVAADSLNINSTKNGQLDYELQLDGGLKGAMEEDDQKKRYEALANHAYYNNGETSMDISDGALLTITEFKDSSTAETFNGKKIKTDAIAIGQTAVFQNEGNEVKVEGGISFRQIDFRDDSTITAISGNSGVLNSEEYGVSLEDDFVAVHETDSSGKTVYTQVASTNLNASDKKSGDQLGIMNSDTTSQIVGTTEKGDDILVIRHTSDGVKYTKGDGSSALSTDKVEIETVDAGEIQYGSAKIESLKVDDKDSGGSASITGVQAVVYTDKSNPDNEITEGLFEISKINAIESDYSVDVLAKDADGVEGKFKILVFENAQGRSVKVFGEDGKRIHLDTIDKDNQHASVLLDTIEYLETDTFKKTIATNLSGSFQKIDSDDDKLLNFNFGRIEGIESLDGNFKQFNLENGSLTQFDGLKESTIGADKVEITQSNYFDTEVIMGSLSNGAISHIEYKAGGTEIGSGKTLEANLSFGSVLATQITEPDGRDITVISAKDMELVAIDYDEMVKLDGKVGSIDFFEDSKIQTLQIKDVEDFKLEDLDSGLMATINSDKVVRVVVKDESGKETSSYLLMEKSFLDIQDNESGVNANIRVGVLEFVQDRLNDQNIILEADVNGKITIDKTKSPIAAEVNFALKGKNLTTQSGTISSNDGHTVENYFSIVPLGNEGRLDKLELSAGPDFLKDAISIQAKGSEEGGKELTFSFKQDKKAGTYYLKAEFKEGDKVKVKFFPFTLESKKEGDDAVAELLVTPRGQNYLNHMQIIANIVSADEVFDWLEVGEGGMLIARTGTLGGFGFEMIYQDSSLFSNEFGPEPFDQSTKRASTIGAGVYKLNDQGDRTAVGVMLTGDSEVEYQTNGKGVLQIAGVDMNEKGSIPATINIYFRKEYADGDSFYAGLFSDLTTYMIDEQVISPDARYFDGNRQAGGTGATFAYSKNLGQDSHLTFTAGANQDFSNPAFCITFVKNFGAPVSKSTHSTIRQTMKAMDRIREPETNDYLLGGPTLQGAGKKLRAELQELGERHDGLKAIERIVKSLNDTVAAIEDGTLSAHNLTKILSISREDIEKYEAFELETTGRALVTRDLKGILFTFEKSISRTTQVDEIKIKKETIRRTMKRLTDSYNEENAPEVFEAYSKKAQEYQDLYESQL